MPANRSRTLEWRRCLKQVFERGGALEIAVANNGPGTSGDQHLVWRVRLLGLTENEIIVEQPCTLGQLIPIDQGIQLVVVLSIGQNRWMFTTANLVTGDYMLPPPQHRPVPALRLAMPESVERCQRRSHHRVETATLTLPQAEIWPLLDPKSVLLAERAYELQHEAEICVAGKLGAESKQFDDESVMPEVGPKFSAGGAVLNLGGGGVGVRIGPQDGQAVARHKLLWLRIGLPPMGGVATPICATGKVVHTHIESNHDTYVGLAFDFSFNPSHQKFVVDQICRYISMQQKAQLHRFVVPDEKRKTA